jgi:hypothetical protein
MKRSDSSVLMMLFSILDPTVACSQVPQVRIPRSNLSLETLVFAPGQSSVRAVPLGNYRICRDGAMTPEFGVPSIRMWTGQIFETAAPVSAQCAFAVYSKQRYHHEVGDIKTADCIARIRTNGSNLTSIKMFVNFETKRHYFQCEYRLSMAFIGFQGALYIAEQNLFVASDRPEILYGYPISRAYSQVMPAPFVHLQWACRIAPVVVYRPGVGQSRAQVEANFRNSRCKKT